MVAVIRDSAGRVVAALSKNPNVSLGPLDMEAVVLAEGVRFAWKVAMRSEEHTSELSHSEISRMPSSA